MLNTAFTRPAVVVFTALALNFGIAAGASAQDAVPQVITDKSAAGELEFWNKIKESPNKVDFQTYLQNFPNGMFFDPAMQKYLDAGGSKDELTAGGATATQKIETVTPPAPVVAKPPAAKPKPAVAATKKKVVAKKVVVKSSVKTKKKKVTTLRAKKAKVASCGSMSSKGCLVKTKAVTKAPKRKVPARETPYGGGGGGGGNSGGGGGWSG